MKMIPNNDKILELKKVTVVHAVTAIVIDLDIFNRCSSFSKLLRVAAYCLRFISIIKNIKVALGPVTVLELRLAENRIIKLIQGKYFVQELKA